MTVSTVEAGVVRAGNSVTTEFSFSFEAKEAAEIKVSIISGTSLIPVTSGFSVSINPGGAGGSVTFSVAPPTGQSFYIFRDTSLTQLVSTSSQQKYDPEVVESVWDKLTFIVQELRAAVDRAIKTVPGQTGDDLLNAIDAAVTNAVAAANTATSSASSAAASANAADASADQAAAIVAQFPSLVGQALRFVRVNGAETAFEYLTALQSLIALGERTSGTGSLIAPVGTTAQRDASPQVGFLRYNSTTGAFEGFTASGWAPVGGGGQFRGNNGLVGVALGDIFRLNAKTLTANVTIGALENAQAAGPLEVASGITLEVAAGGSLVIV